MAARDPGAPTRPGRKELLLLCGFLLCVVAAVITVVLPELGTGDSENKKPAALPAGPSTQSQ
jgi:hypothetical protein